MPRVPQHRSHTVVRLLLRHVVAEGGGGPPPSLAPPRIPETGETTPCPDARPRA